MPRLRSCLILCLLGLLAVTAGTASATAATVSTTTLAIKGFRAMVVDPASHHVFISGDPYQQNSAILVLHADGSPAGSISGESGAGDMVLSGGKLYVARCGWGMIDVIDTTTLTKVDSITASVGGACHLGLAGGRLWYGTTDQWNTLTSVTVDAPHTVATYPSIGSIYQPRFLGDPSHPDRLYMTEDGSSPPNLWVLDVSTATPTVVQELRMESWGDVDDWALTPDGSTLYVAAGAPYSLLALHTSDLSAAGTYPTGPYPSAVDLSPNGSHVTGGVDLGSDNVQQFPIGNAVPDLSVDTADQTTQFTPSGAVRYSENGSLIFAVTEDTYGTIDELHVVSALPASGMTITATPKTVSLGGSVNVGGHLTLPAGAVQSGHTVHVYATAPGGVEAELGTTTTNSFGNWYYAVPGPLTGGTWTVRAAFDGETAYAPSSASTTVAVGNPPPSLTVTADHAAIVIGKHVAITAHLGAWHSNDIVSIYRSTNGGAPELAASGPVTVDGTFTAAFSPTVKTTYTARWAGDDTYLPAASGGVTVSVRSRIAISQSGYYAVSRGVHLYHYRSGCWTRSSGCPHFLARLYPSLPGATVTFTLQRRTAKGWITTLSGKASTNSRSVAAAIYRYTGTALIGRPMRVRASWVGNGSDLGSHSAWTYFRLTN
ncbi:MAG TPA: hypothetical protein VFJ66_06170 [Gaiellales bacterium]|nr:hypothetical protein [Gaiellales bacterium]